MELFLARPARFPVVPGFLRFALTLTAPVSCLAAHGNL